MSFAWKLPALVPWKSLLLLDDEGEQDWGQQGYSKGKAHQMQMPVASEDRELAEQLLRFMELASIHLSYVPSLSACIIEWC